MMKKSILLLTLASFIGFANAQESGSKQPCLKVTSFSSSLGFGGAMTSNTDADYYILKDAVDNPGLFVDIKGLNSGDSYWDDNSWNNGMYFSGNNGGSGNGNLLFNLGLTPYSKKLGKYRENRELRFSAGGSFGTRNSFYYYENNSFVIDSYQSENGNGLVYADSSINKYYSYTLDFSEVNFGLSYLFKTDVNRRVHFYAGIGVNYGIALKSTVSVNEDDYKGIIYYNEFDKPDYEKPVYYYDDNDNYSHSYSSSTTNLKSPMQFVRAYIPMGLSLRLSKKPSSFFNHVDLYTELNPGVEFQILSSEKSYANPYFGVAFIGFNYHW